MSDGILSYSIDVASIFQSKNIYAKILSTGKFSFPEGKEELFQKIETSYETYWEDVIKLAKFIEQKLPCVIILNKQMQMLYAAILLKKRFPEYVKIVSVIQCSVPWLTFRIQLLNQALCLGSLMHITESSQPNGMLRHSSEEAKSMPTRITVLFPVHYRGKLSDILKKSGHPNTT